MPVQIPEEAVRSMVDEFNSGDLDTFVACYEPRATLVTQPGQVASGAEAMGGFLAVVQADDVVLVSGSCTFTGPDGEPVTMSGRTTDDTWRLVIDFPFGIG